MMGDVTRVRWKDGSKGRETRKVEVEEETDTLGTTDRMGPG